MKKKIQYSKGVKCQRYVETPIKTKHKPKHKMYQATVDEAEMDICFNCNTPVKQCKGYCEKLKAK